jgi:hypothetical protein
MSTARQVSALPTNKLTAALVTNGLWELIEPALIQLIPYLDGKAAAILLLQTLLMGGVSWLIPDRANVPVTP